MDYPYINIHTHWRTGEGIEMMSILALMNEIPEQPCSVGIHPWQVSNIDLEAALNEVATAPVNAIGEIGLDFSLLRGGFKEEQQEVFRAQLAIAQDRRLPVILHCVRAFEPVIKILSDYTLSAVIFHDFVGSPQQAAVAAKAGYYLSFGNRSFNSIRTMRAMDKATPREQMFLETDDSKLSITYIYKLANRVLRVTVDELRRQIFDNYTKIFDR